VFDAPQTPEVRLAEILRLYGEDPLAWPDDELERLSVTRAEVVEHLDELAAKIEAQAADADREALAFGMSEQARREMGEQFRATARRFRRPAVLAQWRSKMAPPPAAAVRFNPRRARLTVRQPRRGRTRSSRGSPSGSAAHSRPADDEPAPRGLRGDDGCQRAS
jgi:hypothetical protein